MADTPKRTGAVLRAIGPQVSAALERVRRGELSVEQYVEERLDQAMAHVDPSLPPEQRARAREVLREHIATDPLLSKQLAQLTGKSAPEA
ncbi:MAG TPA: hypothetical protein VNG33_11685 [Polyangiaceae bacterium]|nr:hypothetical protein [Polyangiaceae bacterium]